MLQHLLDSKVYFSSQQWKNIVKSGLVGAVAMAGVEIVFSMMQTVLNHEDLSPETESLIHLPELFRMCIQLQEVRHLHEPTYNRFIHKADEFARLHEVVAQNNMHTRRTHTATALCLTEECLTLLHKLLKISREDRRFPAAKVAKFKDLVQDIKRALHARQREIREAVDA